MGNLKSHLNDLAVLGGTPAFSSHLHVGRPNVGNRNRLMALINNVLETRCLTNNGPYVQEFERRIEDVLGVKHCIATCNATIALQIVARALGLTGEVIVPSFTFVATAHALAWEGLTPVFCDIDFNTHNLDPSRIEERITGRTTAILGVHVWGRPCEVRMLQNVATRHGLVLLFDSAHGFGCSYRQQVLGNFGAAEIFSFHATKFLNTLEGGAIVTNDDRLAHKVRLMINFGFSNFDRVQSLGTNAKMNEISAATGLTNLDSCDEFIALNKANYERYQYELEDIVGLKLVSYDLNERNNFQYVVVELDEVVAGIGRDELQQILWAENILARRYFYPGCHRLEPYCLRFPNAGFFLPQTEKLTRRVLCLPTGTSVTAREIQKISQIIKLAIRYAHDLPVSTEVTSSTRAKESSHIQRTSHCGVHDDNRDYPTL